MIPHSRPMIADTDIAAVVARLQSGMLAEGDMAASLERQLASKFGFADAVAVGSGCQGLLLALRLRGVRAGSRVALPTYVCPEVLGVVEAMGAEPILADVTESYALDPADQAFTHGAPPAAIVLPSLFGLGSDPAPHAKRGAAVIADWAQFLPGPDRPAKDQPDIAVLSFEATKILAGGEGGAVLLRDAGDAARLRAMRRVAGTDFKLNLYPMSDLQAALISAQLDRLDAMCERRASIAAHYDAAFTGALARNPTVQAPFRYVVRTRKHGGRLDEVIAACAAQGVAVRRPVAVMLHQIRSSARVFPVADRLFAETLSLPLYPALTDMEIERVVAVIKDIVL